MGILQLLAKENYITYHKGLAKKIGVDEAILFGEMCSLSNVYGDEFFFEQEKLMEETCLTEYRVRNAVKTLQEVGLLKVERKGMPAKNYYTLNEDVLIDMLDLHRTSCAKFDTTRGCNFDTTDGEKEKSTKKEKDTHIYSNNIREEKKNKENEELFDEMFDAFWKEYPYKANKKGAKTSFKRIKNLKDEFPLIMEALERFKQSNQWTKQNGEFIPLPTSWINQERWKDKCEIKSSETTHRSITSKQSQDDVDKLFAEIMANGRKGNS